MSADRTHLRFPDACERVLSPSLRRYGFRRTSADALSVVYEASLVQVVISHDPRDYVIDVWLTELETGLRISLVAIAAFVRRHSTLAAEAAFQASTPERVETGLLELARFLDLYAGPALEGDHQYFRDCIVAEREILEAESESVATASIRNDASAAWKRGEYAEVVKLYQRFPDTLTPADAAKLRYALRQIR